MRNINREWEREQEINAAVERASANIRDQAELKRKLGRRAARLWIRKQRELAILEDAENDLQDLTTP